MVRSGSMELMTLEILLVSDRTG